jgi:dipeptidyl aminopeptidase/acylaminoacyl peptidase
MTGKKRFIFICIVLIFTFSCGGGGGGDNGNEETGETLNPGVEGLFLINHGNGLPLIMDAKTGKYTDIPNTHWAIDDDRFAPIANMYSYYAKPIKNSNMVFSVRARGGNDSYVAIQDYDGNFLSKELHLNESIESVSVSQDLRYIALSRYIHGVSTWFEIFTWDGTLLNDRELDTREFHWLMDNRILYAEKRTFYFTKRLSTEVESRLILPESFPAGHIDTISISPDESQIAFTLAEVTETDGTHLTNSRLYIVNIDGSSPRLVATTYNDQDPRLTYPEWSPDGRSLYIQEGYGMLSPAIGTDDKRDMYILPTEYMGKVFMLSTDDTERSIEVKRFWRFNTIDDEPGGITGKASPLSSFYWINNSETK